MAVSVSESFAQGRTSSNGLFGSRTLGGSISGGNRSFTGTPGNRLDQQADTGNISGNERFVRGSRQPGQFVGADSGDARNFFSQLGGGGLGAGLGSNLRRNQNRSVNNQGQSQAGSTPIRARLTIGFSHTPPTTSAVSEQIAANLASQRRIQAVSPISAAFADQVLVLRGRVATAEQRALAERLALLEPGVWRVRNEIQIGPAGRKPPAPNEQPADPAPEPPHDPADSLRRLPLPPPPSVGPGSQPSR